jgi:hypothetical protein
LFLADPCNRKANISDLKYLGYHFSIRANPFHRVCLFCNFVRNRIYVMEIEVLGPVVLASKHKFLKAGFLAYILNVSAIFGFEVNHNMWDAHDL